MTNLLDNPDFKATLDHAKQFAIHERRYAVTIRDMLTGFASASSCGDAHSRRHRLIEKLEQLDDDIIQSVGVLERKGRRDFNGRLDVHHDLRKLLGEEGAGFEEFIEKCLETHGEQLKSDTELVCFGFPKHRGLVALWAICTAIQEFIGQSDLDGGILAVALKMASEQGVLDGSPVAKSLVAAHVAAIGCLERERGWSMLRERITTGSWGTARRLRPEFREALGGIHSVPDPLLQVVKIGLAAARHVERLERVAFHEAGHAVMSLCLRPGARIVEISILSKPCSDGRVVFEDGSRAGLEAASRGTVHEELLLLLAGRVAEKKKFGPLAVDAGAADDLKRATALLWSAITRLGLDPEFGPINLAGLPEGTATTACWLVDEAQKRLQILLKAALSECSRLIEAQWSTVEELASDLLKHKVMTGDEVLQVCQQRGGWSPDRIKAVQATIFDDLVAV